MKYTVGTRLKMKSGHLYGIILMTGDNEYLIEWTKRHDTTPLAITSYSHDTIHDAVTQGKATILKRPIFTDEELFEL